MVRERLRLAQPGPNEATPRRPCEPLTPFGNGALGGRNSADPSLRGGREPDAAIPWNDRDCFVAGAPRNDRL